MSELEKQKKRRGRQAPSFPLAQAVEMLERVHTNLGDGPFSREAIAEALGYKTVSGSVNIRIGTLTHFGLLERTKGASYSVSAIGRRILVPQSDGDRREAISEAARSPTLYREILESFGGHALPQMFGNTLVHKFGVLTKQRDEVAEVFREAMLFAGLLRNGILHEEPTAVEETEPDSASDDFDADDGDESVAQARVVTAYDRASTRTRKASASSHQEYTIPLNRSGRVAHVYLPTPVETRDLKNIERWAKFMAEFEIDDQEMTDDENILD